MFKIRREMMEAFDREMDRTLPRRILDRLRERDAGRCEREGDRALLETIRRDVERAAAYGLTSEEEVSLFVEYAFVYGPEFDKERWAARALSDEGVDDRVLALLEAAQWHDSRASRRR